MPVVGKCDHEQAMSIIYAASGVSTLSYEEAIATYLRARHLLKDDAKYMASPIPDDWELPHE